MRAARSSLVLLIFKLFRLVWDCVGLCLSVEAGACVVLQRHWYFTYSFSKRLQVITQEHSIFVNIRIRAQWSLNSLLLSDYNVCPRSLWCLEALEKRGSRRKRNLDHDLSFVLSLALLLTLPSRRYRVQGRMNKARKRLSEEGLVSHCFYSGRDRRICQVGLDV